MALKVRGLKETQKSINDLLNDTASKKAISALYKGLNIAALQAAIYTPIDTSTLINSQFREVGFKGSRIVGRIGYAANYAVYVNDPNVPQNFRRSTAQKEFLRKGFEDSKDQVIEAIKEGMKT
ncbi:HK97 gp10 family phage protein [Lonsdalea quercina]|uniref:HK97 gp10 family phage protein n=1 Tax=Lonsdalea quercina TaxID=71657 RepID=UPI003974A396